MSESVDPRSRHLAASVRPMDGTAAPPNNLTTLRLMPGLVSTVSLAQYARAFAMWLDWHLGKLRSKGSI